MEQAKLQELPDKLQISGKTYIPTQKILLLEIENKGSKKLKTFQKLLESSVESEQAGGRAIEEIFTRRLTKNY